MELTLRTVRGGVAQFALVMGLHYEGEGRAIDVRLRGDVRIEVATGHVLELRGKGPVSGPMDGAAVTGTMTWSTQGRWVSSH